LIEAFVGLLVIGTFAVATAAVQNARVGAARAEADRLEANVALGASRRRQAGALGAEVARLQQLGAESLRRRGSGNEVARALALIGNAIPQADWLDSIERHPDGYLVSGGSPSLDDVGGVISSVERVAPGYRTSLLHVIRDDRHPTVHFALQLVSPPNTAPSPVATHS